MAILIAAPASGSGKTTMTLAMLAVLHRRGLVIQSFKVGPDYIDPMFHTALSGIPCRNLDPILSSVEYVQNCFATHVQARDGAIVEGVMGLFDGKAGSPCDQGSSAHIARLLGIPVVLVIDGSGMGNSVAALVYGLCHFDPRLTIAGVILNRVGSERHGSILRQAVESVGIPVLGVVPREQDLSLSSRHLGLVPVGELPAFESLTDRLADLGEQCLDWDRLLPLVRDPTSSKNERSSSWGQPDQFRGLRIAIAWDHAFNFYYADTFDLLRYLGAELVFFSPLSSGFENLGVDGLLLGGGFPELFAPLLSERLRSFQFSYPIYAECGGLMVLGQQIIDLEQQSHDMAGILPFSTAMGSRLVLGYRQATVQQSTIVVKQGGSLWGHEFHRSQMVPNGSNQDPQDRIFSWDNNQTEGWALDRIHASYLHLHWGGNPHLAHRFCNLANLQNFPDQPRAEPGSTAGSIPVKQIPYPACPAAHHQGSRSLRPPDGRLFWRTS
ncbi:MAG: cobyrinate a,c-diamide synthase [Synechococcaceae cyanobacterium SM2_3_2]|nr:cobyrinate a,c-diamide synthase [Synechococcaceae cyanobacterium SM2_3_2]